MISICLFGDLEKDTEVGFRLLIDYMDEQNLKQVTPMFPVVSGDESF
ncbi:hypothetical protein [Aquibacillus kalidii]|nr:hypothetical protein [Aquibacillus kalidii]